MTARKWGSNQDANGLKLINVGAPADDGDAATKKYADDIYDAAISRANHQGTQLANTVSDFDTQVRTNRLDQLAAPTSSVSMANQKIINLLDPTAAQDAATKAYVDSQLGGVTAGLNLRGTARVASSEGVLPGGGGYTVLDGVTLADGDIVLLSAPGAGGAGQAGPYRYDGDAQTFFKDMTWWGAADQVGSFWVVTEGTHADQFAIMTNDTFDPATSAASFTYIGATPGAVAPVEQDIGNGAATSFTITHNFGTRAVSVLIYRNASPWDEIDVYVRRPDVNTVVIDPDLVFAANEYHVVVSKL